MPYKRVPLIVFLLCAEALVLAAQPRHFLVGFRAGTPDAQADATIAQAQGHVLKKIPQIRIHVIELPATADENALLNRLKNRPEVEFVELDESVPPSAVTPNDPAYANQWALAKVNAPAAWAITTGSSNVVVAILDSGVDGAHPDLAGKIVPGWNIYNDNSNTSDVCGHGTTVAGTVAAATNNGIGVASVCWNCMIMPVRVSDPTGYALFSNLAGGVTWAADHGASVANMSYEVSASSAVTCAAQYFVSKGGVVTASAGNGGKFVSASPNPYILTVGATDPNDARYSWSNCGNNIDLVAPGCSFTTNMGGGYGVGCGTSYSAPMVAGAAALLQSAQPSLTPAGVSTCLKQSAHDLGATGWDTTFGYGRLDLSAALVLAGSGGSTDTTPPVVSITAPATGTTVSGNVPVYVAATDNVSVVSVSVAVDGAAFCTMTAGPYACTWNSASCANGIHTLTATARDAAGNTSAASVTVTVSNLTDTTPPTGGGGSLPLRCSCPSVPLRDFEGMLLMFVRKDC